MLLVFYKILVSVVVVLVLTEISKRVNPVLGGILTGLPLGAGLAVYFISVSAGVEYVLRGIPWAIGGLTSSILCCGGYYLTGKYGYIENRQVEMAICSAAGFFLYFISAIFIYQLGLTTWSALVVFLIFYLFNLALMTNIHNLRQADKRESRADSLRHRLVRGVMVGIIVVIITSIAVLAGSKWSGILSSFPSTLYPLVLILHFEEGSRLYPHVIYGFSFSIITLVVFYLSCLTFLPRLGLGYGFVVIYLISFFFLYGLNKLRARCKDKTGDKDNI